MNSERPEKGYQCTNWYTIEDLGGASNLTIEDYLYDSYLQIGMDEVLGPGKKKIHDKGGVSVMCFLQDVPKDQKNELKMYYATNAKTSDIKPSYYVLLQNLWDKISSFSSMES